MLIDSSLLGDHGNLEADDKSTKKSDAKPEIDGSRNTVQDQRYKDKQAHILAARTSAPRTQIDSSTGFGTDR